MTVSDSHKFLCIIERGHMISLGGHIRHCVLGESSLSKSLFYLRINVEKEPFKPHSGGMSLKEEETT